MESLSGIFSRIALRAAIVSIILGLIARFGNIQNQVGQAHLPWLFGITSDALLRFTDTCLLFTIAFALLQLISKKDSKDSEAKQE